MTTNQVMYDSVNTLALPSGATLILAYIDGKYANLQPVRTRFPKATVVPVTTTIAGDLNAQVYDCERGDGNATNAVLWAGKKLAIPQRPTIYCSRIGSPGYGLPDVLNALKFFSIPPSAIDLGIADYTGKPHLYPGSAFTQYANPPSSGGDYDISVTDGIWPNHPTEPITMLNKPASCILATPDSKGYLIVAQDGGVFAYGDCPYFGSLPSLGVVPAAPIISATLAIEANKVIGYWLLGSDGGVFAFPSSLPFYGAPNK